MYCPSRYKTILTGAGPQTSPFPGGQYTVENGNLCKFRPTYWHGTAFPQKDCLYQKEATGMESAKMYCPSRRRNRTYQCRASNYPVSWGAELGREWKFVGIRAYLSASYCVSTKGIFTSKGSYGYGERKNVLL